MLLRLKAGVDTTHVALLFIALPWQLRSPSSCKRRGFLRDCESCNMPGSEEPYSELAPHYARMRAEVEGLMACCRAAGLVVTGALGGAISIDAAAAIAAAVPNTVEGVAATIRLQCTASSLMLPSWQLLAKAIDLGSRHLHALPGDAPMR